MSKARTPKRRFMRTAQPKERGLRMCCACRAKAPRDELLRFVIDEEGHVWLDRHLKAPGRGAHLCYQRACIERALKRRSFNASFKRSTQTPPLDELLRLIVEAQLSKLRDLIALAQRKRLAISGLNLLESSRAGLLGLILASDIADHSRTRLEQWGASSDSLSVAQAPLFSVEATTWCAEQDPAWGEWYTAQSAEWSSDQLGALVGRGPRVAMGLAEPQHAQRLNVEISRIPQVLVAHLIESK